MNSTSFKTSILAGILISSSLLLSSPTLAVGPTERKTTADITFETLKPVEVVDPFDPDNPKTPGVDEGDVNGDAGELTLDFAPNLYFGKKEITKDGTYTYPALINSAAGANPGEKTSDPFIQVTDRQLKPGNWRVTVKASHFKNSLTNLDSLDEAYLTFENGVLNRPTANASAVAPTLKPNIRVETTDTETEVLTAKDGEGELTWVAHWIPTSQNSSPKISLTVKAGTIKKGTHTSNLTWTLIGSGTP